MASTFTVSRQVYDLVVEQARQAHQTPDAVAEELLRRTLTPEMGQWRSDFDALISRVQHRTTRFDPSEIEADITAAWQEVKEMRRARGRRH